mgnify:FL=1
MKKLDKYDYLIVGSGLYGATFARLAREAGKACLVIDRRSHVGGNVHCERVENINVHGYGPHIFHTRDKKVWSFINRFTSFNRFTLCTIANYHGELYNLPFNMNTFHQMWSVNMPEEALAIIESQRYKGEVTNLEEQALSLVGRDIYEKLIRGYTEKQWGRACRELPSFIIRRIPVRLTYDNNYFNDPYQGIPIGGYNKLMEGLLEGCDVRTDTDFFDGLYENWRNIADKLLYTGKIDDFYGCRYGRLQYRSLRFETFGDEVYDNPKTVITREYPINYVPSKSEPYYPINDERNSQLYGRYRKLAARERDVIFGGRLAEYRYYNMDQVMARAMEAWAEQM